MNQLILIGASNVTIAFPRLVNGLAEWVDEPLEIWGVHGHGRSYGAWSKVLGRALPGITESRFWDDWAPSGSSAPPRALVTDIGNDILYGHDTDQILDWVETCLKRLQDLGAKVVMTRLPLASLETLSRIRFTLARKILFPRCGLSLADVSREARKLDAGVVELAQRYSTPLTEPQGHWYGLDPIHIRSRWIESAWQQILDDWFDGGPPPSFPRVGIRRDLQAWRWWPAERARRGHLTETPQPVFQQNGLNVRLY